MMGRGSAPWGSRPQVTLGDLAWTQELTCKAWTFPGNGSRRGWGNGIHPGRCAVRAGSCVKDGYFKMLTLAWNTLPKESPWGILVVSWGISQSLNPSPAFLQTGCPAIPKNLLALNPLNATGGFGRFHCLKCLPFIKLESESLHLPYIGHTPWGHRKLLPWPSLAEALHMGQGTWASGSRLSMRASASHTTHPF